MMIFMSETSRESLVHSVREIDEERERDMDDRGEGFLGRVTESGWRERESMAY